MSAEELDFTKWNDPYARCVSNCRHDLGLTVLTNNLLSTSDGPYPTKSPFAATEPIILGELPLTEAKPGLKAAWVSTWRRSTT